MILNPNVKTVELPVGVSWARLTGVKHKVSYEFLVNPEEVVWQHNAVFKDLPVLYTSQPQVSYQSSQSTLAMPKVYLWTPGNAGGLDAIIAQLVAMTKPVLGDNTPPILSITWGATVVPKAYLKGFNIREQQWRGGQVTQATASFEFTVVPEAVATQKTETTLKLTSREQGDYVADIKAVLVKDANRAKNLGLDPKKDLKVASDGTILYTGKPIGNLKDKFRDLVKAKHK